MDYIDTGSSSVLWYCFEQLHEIKVGGSVVCLFTCIHILESGKKGEDRIGKMCTIIVGCLSQCRDVPTLVGPTTFNHHSS